MGAKSNVPKKLRVQTTCKKKIQGGKTMSDPLIYIYIHMEMEIG